MNAYAFSIYLFTLLSDLILIKEENTKWHLVSQDQTVLAV